MKKAYSEQIPILLNSNYKINIAEIQKPFPGYGTAFKIYLYNYLLTLSLPNINPTLRLKVK